MLLAPSSDPMHVYKGVPVTLPRSRKAAQREWRNRQTRTVQVRVLERVWGFNSPLAHQCDESRHRSRRTPRSSCFGGHFFGQYRWLGLMVCSLSISPVFRSVTVTVWSSVRMMTATLACFLPMPSRCIFPALRSETLPDSSMRSYRILCWSKPLLFSGWALMVAV